MGESSIEWTDKTWNPTRGCRRVSPGCGGASGEGGCYAERQAARFSGPGMPFEGLVRLGTNGPRWTGDGRFVPEKLREPLSWTKPARIFVDSMSDLFFEAFTNEEIAAVFGVMAACPQHTFQILTKRPERMRRWFLWLDSRRCHGNTMTEECRSHAIDLLPGARRPDGSSPPGRHRALFGYDDRWPLPNVWLGVSVEDQRRANERVMWLLNTPAAVRFVSCEPLLDAVDLTAIDFLGAMRSPPPHNLCTRLDALRGHVKGPDDVIDSQEIHRAPFRSSSPHLDWVIVGGESGPGSRPFDVAWARSLVKQCRDAKVACFVKQLGANVRTDGIQVPGEYWPRGTSLVDDRDPRGGFAVPLHSKKGGAVEQWPADLRIREFPEVVS